MNEEHLSSLLLARGLLDRGRAAVNGTGAGAMAAVVLVDLAVETAGKAALGSEVDHDLKFHTLLDKLDGEARTRSEDQARLTGLGHARKLRKLRNGVQHDGNEPSARDVERAAVWAEEFIDEVAQRFFALSLQELSRASLITDAQARSSIAAAEEAAAVEHYSEAAGHLAIAFEQAHMAFRDQEPWRKRLRVTRQQIEKLLQGLTSDKVQSSRRNDLEKLLKAIPNAKVSSFVYGDIVNAVFPQKPPDVKPIARLLDDILREVSRIDQRVEAFAVAGDPGEYAWFRQRVPRPSAYIGDGALQFQKFDPDPPFSQQDYLRALDFVVGAAVRWQQAPVEADPGEPDEDKGRRTLAA